jgi:hypothetical protein
MLQNILKLQFINLKSGKRYFFTGGLTWSLKAFQHPSEKHIIPRKQVDHNSELIKKQSYKFSISCNKNQT